MFLWLRHQADILKVTSQDLGTAHGNWWDSSLVSSYLTYSYLTKICKHSISLCTFFLLILKTVTWCHLWSHFYIWGNWHPKTWRDSPWAAKPEDSACCGPQACLRQAAPPPLLPVGASFSGRPGLTYSICAFQSSSTCSLTSNMTMTFLLEVRKEQYIFLYKTDVQINCDLGTAPRS